MIAFLLTAYISTIAQNQSGYQVKGKIAGLTDGSKVYLIHGFKRIDSATVNKEQFTIDGMLAEPAFIYLYIGRGKDSKKLADILLDNRTVLVTGSQDDYDHIKVSGSDIDQQWKGWFSKDQRLGYQQYRLEQVYKSLLGKGERAAADSLKTITDEMMADRITLLKDYVKQYHNSAVGAVLPTLCTLQDKMSQTDFMEMYNVLTPEMKNTEMARETMQLAKRAKPSTK
ncbi:DUF4369 domain-containing protein [Nostoc sp. CHAB 5834]|nr:DUF4369 domain-containing protein [Nostoc sp. CHAB 5834]